MRPAKTLIYLMGIALSAIYILNPGAGVIELLPDNLPIVGNLDDVSVGRLAFEVIDLVAEDPGMTASEAAILVPAQDEPRHGRELRRGVWLALRPPRPCHVGLRLDPQRARAGGNTRECQPHHPVDQAGGGER